MNNDKIIRYRTNGYIVEFDKNNGALWFYVFRKSLAFIFDYMIYVAFLMIFIYAFKSSLLQSFIITYFLFFMYILGSIFLFKGKTLGMLIGGLVFGAYDGDRISGGKLVNRAFVTSIYSIPVLGLILALAAFISMMLNKGITPVDLVTKTQSFNKNFHKYIVYMYRQLENEQNK